MANLSLRAVIRLGRLRHMLAIIVYLALAVTTGCTIQGVVDGSVAPSAEARLAGVSLSEGTLVPEFNRDTSSYSATAANAVGSVSVTATTLDNQAAITVQGISVASGVASAPIALAVGANTITVVVTAADGSTQKTYTIVVTRQPGASHNADLSSLVLSQATLTPLFDPSITSYTATVSGSGASVVVTPTAAESGASIRVQDVLVASGTATQPLPIRPAKMSITVDVTASDGTTQKSYVVVVQLMGWQLNETNTGLAGAGIDKNSLPVYDGPSTLEQGTVISLKKITTPLILVNGNITLDRCWIQPADTWGVGSLVFTYDPFMGTASQYPNTIIDCDIDGSAITDPYVYADCAVRGIATVQRSNIFGMGDGICVFGSGQLNALIENNYVHDLRGGIYGGQQSHNESATIRSFDGTSLIWRNNYLISRTGSDSGALFIQAWAGYIDHVLIEGNLFYTANWCIALEANNFGYGNDMKANNNRFVDYGYGPVAVSGGPGWAEWTENYYDDPADPDHKGEPAN